MTTTHVPNGTVNGDDAAVVQSGAANKDSDDSSNDRSYPMAAAQYEEVAQSPEIFWEKLEAFHRSFKTKFAAPMVGGKVLDLHHLFVEVTSRGGIERVIRDRKWKEVTGVFNFPTTITSASFVLRKFYLSLLYHFEQVYFFHKKAQSISNPDGNPSYESTTLDVLKEDTPKLQRGCTVTGRIDGKFDNGYIVSVNLGLDELKGVLYHIPPLLKVSGSSSATQQPRHKSKKSQLAIRDPSRPKPNRSGYTFFFAENYGRLKPSYYGQEKAISKEIGLLWSNLTEAEKQVYQEKGLKDKQRYQAEMMEYRSNLDLEASIASL